jgi:hypothetical protein
MTRTKTANKLPLGVTTVNNRPGLYRLSVMISGKRYREYHRPDDGLTQRQLQSALQKAIDAFREKAERGSLLRRLSPGGFSVQNASKRPRTSAAPSGGTLTSCAVGGALRASTVPLRR